MAKPTFTEFRDYVKEAVSRVGESFTKADDDWAPVLLIQDNDGALNILYLAFNDEDKEKLSENLAHIFVDHPPKHAALVLSGWQRTIKTTEPLAYLTLSITQALGVRHDPQSNEIVVLELSDGNASETWIALITRFETKPVLWLHGKPSTKSNKSSLACQTAHKT